MIFYNGSNQLDKWQETILSVHKQTCTLLIYGQFVYDCYAYSKQCGHSDIFGETLQIENDIWVKTLDTYSICIYLHK